MDMFNKVLTTEKKEFFKLFSDANGKLRLIIATLAFDMGVDCTDIRRIVNWGTPSILEESVQESG